LDIPRLGPFAQHPLELHHGDEQAVTEPDGRQFAAGGGGVAAVLAQPAEDQPRLGNGDGGLLPPVGGYVNNV